MEYNKLNFILTSVIAALWISHVNASGLCSSDSNCTSANTACVLGVCSCAQGFSPRNGQCTQVFGRTCFDDLDCDDGRTLCDDSGQCKCRGSEWQEINGICVSYYGFSCNTWTDCGNSDRYDCVNKTCTCEQGYRYANTTCEKVLDSVCLLSDPYAECPLANAACKRWGWWLQGSLYGLCKCDAGYTEKDGLCIKVIGSNCQDVGCGNTLHFSYQYLSGKSEVWDTNHWGYYEPHHLHLSCNLDNVCTCDHGFVSTGITCSPVMGRGCTNRTDCGQHHGYVCNEQTSRCECAPGFQSRVQRWDYKEYKTGEHDDYWYYSHWYNENERQYVDICLPVTGQSCMHASCSIPYSTCNNNNTCVCSKGYTETNTGMCEQVLGLSCFRETLCQIVEGGTCGRDGICVCKQGYTSEGHECLPVLGSNCSSDHDCQLSNSFCQDGSCTCATGLKEFDHICLREECAQHVPILPDLHRRSVFYRSLGDEPVIDDSLLEERWYSIGEHSLLVSRTIPDPGNCSTYHPIYLKDELSAEQVAMMKTSDVSLSIEVGRLNDYDVSDVVNIKMRTCGADTQIYVQPPQTHFSGLCLRGNERVLSTRRSSGMYALVVPDLLFKFTQENNRNKSTPYLVFSCLPSELFGNTYSRYPHENFQSDNDLYFYYVHWYIDGIHYRSFGPVRRNTFVNDSSIFESDILDAGYKLGFKIQCSFEMAENPNSNYTLLTISDEFVTGLQEIFIEIDENVGSIFYQLSSGTPLGCESSEDDNTTRCDLNWTITDEQGASICKLADSEASNPEACSFSIKGYTALGYAKHGLSWRYEWNRLSQYRDTRNDTHQLSTNENFGMKIDVTGDLKVQLDNFKILLSASGKSTGHRLWEGSDAPYINGRVIKRLTNVPNVCNITLHRYPVVSMDEWAPLSENVVIDAAGEYILYRSRTSPVEIHVETEVCKDDEVCVCGISYRDRNTIFTINYCHGLARTGQIYGKQKNRNLEKVHFINGMTLTIPVKEGRFGNISFGTNSSSEALNDGEGLCTFGDRSYKFRDGSEKQTHGGFISSWRVPMEESLLNPRNHKDFSWSERYMLCYCSSKEREREVVYSYNYTYQTYNYDTHQYLNMTYIYETANVFSGKFRCSSENLCDMAQVGEEWPSSLLPPFSLDSVIARMEIRYQGVWPFLHLFCDFDRQQAFRYKIVWKLDSDVILESNVMSSTETEQFYITNNDFQSEKFLLEAKFSCGVSVYDDSDVLLLDSLYSDEITAIEFVETEMLLPRGKDLTVQLKLNIPLVCKKASKCHFDFQLFDPNDSYSCSDSTIAFKNKHTCGQRVIGTHTDSALVTQASILNLTVTTKNNDKYMLRDTFVLKMKLVANGATSTFWAQTFKKRLTIFVRDDEAYWQGNYCYANNDPRMRTFDGQYYSNMLVGEFVMMKHKKLPVEVQVETHYYGWYSCGATIRAGRDVFTINHCHGDHITGYLLADDRILKVKQRNEHRYEIYLPHGTRIDVRVSSWWMYMVNVFIYPSPADMQQVEGLCGNFDGNIEGDLIHSDGIVTYPSYFYWWGWWWWETPLDKFIRSWGSGWENARFRSLTDIETLEETLESWYTDDVLCVCTGNNGNGEVKCSANERETCLSPQQTQGVDVSISKRHKRSGQILDKEFKRRLRKMREKREANGNIAKRSISRRSVDGAEVDVNATVASCREKLNGTCGVMSVQDNGLNVTFEELVNNCGQDKAADPDTDWTALTCEAIEANVEHEIQKDVQFQANNPEIVAAIMDNLCVGNCTGNGNCVKGSCECFPGFKASDCSLDLSKEVVIEGITGDGICDIHYSDCSCIRLTTSGSLETSKYKLVHREYDNTSGWKETGSIVGTVDYDNYNEVFVCPEITSRKKRSTSDSTPIANQYDISLSNDGTTFSNGSTVFIIDSTCLQVDQTNGSNTVVLLPGFCIIGGICYATNSSSASDSCLVCNDTAAVFYWTRKETATCNEKQTESESTTIKPFSIGIIAGVSGVVVVAVVLAAIFVVKKTLARRVAVYNGELYDEPRNTKFRTCSLGMTDG